MRRSRTDLTSFPSARGKRFLRPAWLRAITALAGLVLLVFGLRFGIDALGALLA